MLRGKESVTLPHQQAAAIGESATKNAADGADEVAGEDERRQAGREEPLAKGRGAQFNPASRFRRIEVEEEFEYFKHDDDARAERRRSRTEYFVDDSKSIVSENDSPDIPFRYSVNVYRGCLHGCSYCYARPSHEYLDLSAGLDFETKIFVKERAPELLRDWLCRDGYRPEVVTFSGVTDCYQPVERKLRLTRRCLEVAHEAQTDSNHHQECVGGAGRRSVPTDDRV